MHKKTNTKAIGAFVVVGIALFAAFVAYFGGGRFLRQKHIFVAYFDETMKGLNVGAPVLFKGVRVGSVTDVYVAYDIETGKPSFPVYFEIEMGRIRQPGGQPLDPSPSVEAGDYRGLRDLIDNRGMRAQLDVQSLLTGMLLIQLQFFPDSEIVRRDLDPDHFEIPTVPSAVKQFAQVIDELLEDVKQMPIQELLEDARHTIQGIDELVRSEEVKQAIVSLDDTLKSFDQLARDVDKQVKPLGSSLVNTLDEGAATLGTARERLVTLEGSARQALEQARETLATAQALIAQDSQLHYRLTAMLDELSATLRAIRVLADTIEQHPEAFIQGKSAPGGQ